MTPDIHYRSTTLVYGATGARGGGVAARLLDRGETVRVIAHAAHPAATARLAELRRRGAEVVDADLDRPATLAAVARGVDRVFLHPPVVGRPDQTVQQMGAALDAAEGAGVRRMVLATNSVLPGRDSGVAAIEINRAVEELLGARDVIGVVLRPTLYLGNLTAPWSLPRILDGELAYPLPADAAVSWLAPDDAADAAVAALTADVPDRLVVTLAGPAAVCGPGLADAIGASAGRRVRYVPLAPAEFAAGLAPVLGDAAAAAIADLYHYLGGRGAELLDVPSEPVTRSLGLRPRDVEKWASEQQWR